VHDAHGIKRANIDMEWAAESPMPGCWPPECLHSQDDAPFVRSLFKGTGMRLALDAVATVLSALSRRVCVRRTDGRRSSWACVADLPHDRFVADSDRSK